jgi:dTDP-4-dehydrorhamnose reductase
VITLLTGSTGQLGRELRRTVPEDVDLITPTRAEMDLRDADHVARTVAESGAELIINAAAYTAVDGAEDEPDLAYSINGDGPGHLARALARRGGRMIQISTDFVFSGESGSPYAPDSATDPVGVYGASKLEGEKQVMAELPATSIVLRTAWVYSRYGRNFVKTMLRLMTEREHIEVVADQVGSPTWAFGLAQTIWTLALQHQTAGIFHWTDAGVASWYDFAVATRDEARRLGCLDTDCRIEPTRARERGSRAARPPFSVLDKSSTWAVLGQKSQHWRVQLGSMLQETEMGEDHE